MVPSYVHIPEEIDVRSWLDGGVVVLVLEWCCVFVLWFGLEAAKMKAKQEDEGEDQQNKANRNFDMPNEEGTIGAHSRGE